MKALAAASAIGIALAGLTAPPVHADPAPGCDAPGLPACAPVNDNPMNLTPEQRCALYAYQHWTPCNWAPPGADIPRVPVGTPGSF